MSVEGPSDFDKRFYVLPRIRIVDMQTIVRGDLELEDTPDAEIGYEGLKEIVNPFLESRFVKYFLQETELSGYSGYADTRAQSINYQLIDNLEGEGCFFVEIQINPREICWVGLNQNPVHYQVTLYINLKFGFSELFFDLGFESPANQLEASDYYDNLYNYELSKWFREFILNFKFVRENLDLDFFQFISAYCVRRFNSEICENR